VTRIDVVSVDAWSEWREVRLGALREAPYAFSSRLADWQGANDTEERWRERLRAVPFNAIAMVDGRPAGQVSATAVDEGTTELISMWVAPFARGADVGDELINAVIDWARREKATRVVLGVRQTNAHAIELYRRHQFVETGGASAPIGDPACEIRMVRTPLWP
jgi:ribosomal protein S18 acetylase RimI-like enzyme